LFEYIKLPKYSLFIDCLFIESSDTNAYLFQYSVSDHPGVSTVVIRHAEFDYDSGSTVVSDPAPIHLDLNYSYDYHSACQSGDILVVLIGRRTTIFASFKHMDTRCYILKFSKTRQWTVCKSVELDRHGRLFDQVYLYPLLRDDKLLYTFLSQEAPTSIIEILKNFRELFQIDVQTGKHTRIQTKNQLENVVLDAEQLSFMNRVRFGDGIDENSVLGIIDTKKSQLEWEHFVCFLVLQ
jgi:hypothetical protein